MRRFFVKPGLWPNFTLLLLSVLVLFFTVSRVSSRVDYKNTAHIFMLTTLQQWDNDGLLTYHGAPVQTFSNLGDKNNAYYNRLLDNRGNNYYISHPPGAFILNYSLIKLFGLPVSQTSLQIISILLLIISAWIVYAISFAYGSTRFETISNAWGAVGAASIYLLHPINLYAFTFHNFSETIGQFFFLLSALLWIRYSQQNSLQRLMAFLIALFLFIYTDWLAIPFVFALLILLRKKIFRRENLGLTISTAIVVVASGALIGIQYIGISGFEAFKKALGIRYLERSGFFGSTYTDMGYDIGNPESYTLLIRQIIHLLSGSGLPALILIAYAFVTQRKARLFPLLIGLPPLVFAIGLFSATITHYIYMAKFTPVLAIGAGISLSYIISIKKSYLKSLLLFMFTLIFSLSIVWTIFQYNQTMPFEANIQNSLDIEAEKFRQVPKNLRCHYLLQENEEPRIIIYLSFAAQRNIKVLKNSHEADSVLQLRQTVVIPDKKEIK